MRQNKKKMYIQSLAKTMSLQSNVSSEGLDSEFFFVDKMREATMKKKYV